MTQDQHLLIHEAHAHMQGLQNLFRNMEDEPLELLQPFEMVVILQPVIDRLQKVLEDSRKVA